MPLNEWLLRYHSANGMVMFLGETTIGLDGTVMVFNGSQSLVQRSIGNEPSVRSNCDCGDAHEENDVPVRL